MRYFIPALLAVAFVACSSPTSPNNSSSPLTFTEKGVTYAATTATASVINGQLIISSTGKSGDRDAQFILTVNTTTKAASGIYSVFGVRENGTGTAAYTKSDGAYRGTFDLSMDSAHVTDGKFAVGY